MAVCLENNERVRYFEIVKNWIHNTVQVCDLSCSQKTHCPPWHLALYTAISHVFVFFFTIS